jgi:hypothetical protein
MNVSDHWELDLTRDFRCPEAAVGREHAKGLAVRAGIAVWTALQFCLLGQIKELDWVPGSVRLGRVRGRLCRGWSERTSYVLLPYWVIQLLPLGEGLQCVR